jgi:SAM-dependent methyltransferase
MLDSLRRRKGGRRAALVLDALRGNVSQPPEPPSLLEREPPPRTPPGRVTRHFTERMTDEQRAELDRRLPADRRPWWEGLDDIARTQLEVPLALGYEVPGVEEATGLSAVMPPADVHAMTHAIEATGGTLYYGDLVVESLAAAGTPLEAGRRVLDFGCSSGRVSRVLKAYEPEADYTGCDPNAPAVEWAAENLPGIRFFASPLTPPLELEPESYDAAFAISIWSHFDEQPGLAWLEEMRRILKPGGSLLMTTQGFAAARGFVEREHTVHHHDFMRGVIQRLYVEGFEFFSVFEGDDWGVSADGWGMAFMTPEWLLAQTTPAWRTTLYRAGAVEGSQDLFVLQKR